MSNCFTASRMPTKIDTILKVRKVAASSRSIMNLVVTVRLRVAIYNKLSHRVTSLEIMSVIAPPEIYGT